MFSREGKGVPSQIGIVPDLIRDCFEDVTADAIHCFVPHWANRRIIEPLARQSPHPHDKVVVTVNQHGGASDPTSESTPLPR